MRSGSFFPAVAFATMIAGCTVTPRSFPPAAIETVREGGRVVERRYDVDGDGRADRAETLDPQSGGVRAMALDADGDGTMERRVEVRYPRASRVSDAPDLKDGETGSEPVAQQPVGQQRQPKRHLFIISDSIPPDIVADLHAQGRLAYFHRPTRIVSPFPVMTDPCLAEFFGVSPVPGVEAQYFDGQRLSDAPNLYLREGNAPWMKCVDYHLPISDHAFAYVYPDKWFKHGLGKLQEAFEASDQETFLVYMVGTSCTGSKRGRTGHVESLIQYDRLFQELMFRYEGRLDITLMSDHGHHCADYRRMSIVRNLERAGYRPGATLNGPQDLVIPEWGLVSMIAIYAQTPAVAADAVNLGGVELAAFVDGDAVMVLSRDGQARISRDGARYRYEMLRGDPLQLEAIASALRAGGQLDPSGFGDADAWWNATKEHVFPDPLARLWRAFHGLFQNVPTVLLSLEDGFSAGSPKLDEFIDMAAVHGSLRAPSSEGMILSTLTELPPIVRMAELRGMLKSREVAIEPRGARSD
ncbi:MAG: hypothetical protein SF069_10210 [Phycisphaerae bacterium]|nr:hypothetical protein [Phycisphaerae bacterium]